MRLPWPRNPLLAGLDMAGPGMRSKLFLFSWFVGLALGSSANRSCW